MAFDLSCCVLYDMELSVMRYEDAISRAAGKNFRPIGKVFNFTQKIDVETTRYQSQIKQNSIFASQKKCDEVAETIFNSISLEFDSECFQQDIMEISTGSKMSFLTGSVAGTPRSFWSYVSKPSATAPTSEQWVTIPLPYNFDAAATGADAFKVEGYAVAATPLKWDRTTNATTNATTGAAIATPVVTALTPAEMVILRDPKTNSIRSLQVLASSIKFIDYAGGTDGVVNLKITGKTIDSATGSMAVEPFKAVAYATGYNKADGKAIKFLWNAVEITCPNGFKIISQDTNMGSASFTGLVTRNTELQISRPDFAPPQGAVTTPFGWYLLQG